MSEANCNQPTGSDLTDTMRLEFVMKYGFFATLGNPFTADMREYHAIKDRDQIDAEMKRMKFSQNSKSRNPARKD